MFNKWLEGLNRGLVLKLVIVQSLLITISNYLVHFKFSVFGLPLAYSVWCTPAFMVITDLIVRMIGRKLANTVLLLTLIPGMIGTIIGGLIYGSPAIEIARITIASGTCYLLPMLLDVYIFAWLRDRIKAWFVAPGVSGIITTIVMTYLFWGLAFAGGTDPYLSENWYIIATNQILVKCILNLVILLPAYKLLLDWLQRRVQVAAA